MAARNVFALHSWLAYNKYRRQHHLSEGWKQVIGLCKNMGEGHESFGEWASECWAQQGAAHLNKDASSLLIRRKLWSSHGGLFPSNTLKKQ